MNEGQKLEEGRRALSEQERILRGKAAEARASAEAYLREKSWATQGIAAGIGLVLGFLMRRRDCAEPARILRLIDPCLD
jgi:ElaB/YqjD/DUF883 family membrane-anchored ribosome-binding protein